jgi:hypothetical protein
MDNRKDFTSSLIKEHKEKTVQDNNEVIRNLVYPVK